MQSLKQNIDPQGIQCGFNHEGNAEEKIMFMSSLKEIFTDQLENKEVVKGEGETPPPFFTST
jgi:hypothetical protein